jgi:DNA-binding NtrC family response regulator
MEVVILTGHGSVDSAVECTKSGAYSYLQKPCTLEHLLEILKDAYKKKVMNRMNLRESQMNDVLHKAPGGSPLAILRRLKEIEQGAA